VKRLIAAAFAAFACAASAQGLDPGEWEFTTSTTSALLPQPQNATFRRCVRPEDAERPERWLGQGSQQADCSFVHTARSADAVRWEVSCPKTSMRGSGSARTGRGSMQGEMRLAGDVQGKPFEIHTRMSGRRLGPC
jgi:hypothetical protein